MDHQKNDPSGNRFLGNRVILTMTQAHSYLDASDYPFPQEPNPAKPPRSYRLRSRGVHPKWKAYLVSQQDQLDAIERDLATRLPTLRRMVPSPELVFRSLFWCSPKAIKVIILGQDPYPGGSVVGSNWIPHASGVSFSVPDGIPLAASLLSVFQNMVHFGHLQTMPQGGDLMRWAAQGVLLWNTGLTLGTDLKTGKPSSQIDAWEKFSKALLRYLAEQSSLVWMIWGKFAHTLCYDVVRDCPQPQQITTSSHPSPLGKNNTFRGSDYLTGSSVIYPSFVSTDHFRFANRALRKAGARPIDWELEE